ncbi:unnamed protein product [Trichobilharzia szidati]|nr:unnamed protein product [Trichobilharzia szidati]
MVSASRAALVVGLCGLTHAAYSAAQHRSYIRLTEQEYSSLPIDILVQIVLSFIVVCIGLVGLTGNLKEIEAAAEFREKTCDSLGNRPSFYIFHHRKVPSSTNPTL